MKRTSNVHEQELPVAQEEASALIDTLASPTDLLWPTNRWPEMRFDQGLVKDAIGGHGPIRYRVIEYLPGKRVRFAFLGPRGLEGEHGFELFSAGASRSLLRHWVIANLERSMRWQWPLIIRPLHDALLEDALDCALAFTQHTLHQPRRLTLKTKLLRKALAKSLFR